MKRDLELVKELLLLIEKQEDDSKELNIPKEMDRSVVAYHLKLLDQAGYIENNTVHADNGPYWIHASLKWDGHEFLDAIRNDSIWSKTKENIKEMGLQLTDVPLEVLKDYAKLKLKEYLGIDSAQ